MKKSLFRLNGIYLIYHSEPACRHPEHIHCVQCKLRRRVTNDSSLDSARDDNWEGL